jgi:hypothetical protein
MNRKSPHSDTPAPRRKHSATTKLEIDAMEPSGRGREEGEEGRARVEAI